MQGFKLQQIIKTLALSLPLVALAAISIFTAFKLYEENFVAPNVPQTIPHAQDIKTACQGVYFSVDDTSLQAEEEELTFEQDQSLNSNSNEEIQSQDNNTANEVLEQKSGFVLPAVTEPAIISPVSNPAQNQEAIKTPKPTPSPTDAPFDGGRG